MKKDTNNNAITPSKRADTLRAFFKFGRKYPHFWGSTSSGFFGNLSGSGEKRNQSQNGRS